MHRHLVAVVVVPRLVARLTGGGARLPLGEEVWADTSLPLPGDLATAAYRDVFTGATIEATRVDGGTALRLGAVLADFPVALLLPARSPAWGATADRRAGAA